MSAKHFSIFSPQRSGHNAIIQWMLYQNENVDEFREWAESPDEERGWFSVRYDTYVGFHVNKPRDAKVINNLDIDIAKLHASIILNYADEPLPAITEEQNSKTVIILRDWRNYIASHIKHIDRERERHESIRGGPWLGAPLNERVKPNLFKEYATHFINESSYYPILFDRWFASKKYRIKICQDLDLHFTDIGKQSVPSFGGGSSFDKLRLDGQAEQMNVLNRYKMYEDDVSYQELMQDDEIVELNSQMGVYNEDNSN